MKSRDTLKPLLAPTTVRTLLETTAALTKEILSSTAALLFTTVGHELVLDNTFHPWILESVCILILIFLHPQQKEPKSSTFALVIVWTTLASSFLANVSVFFALAMQVAFQLGCSSFGYYLLPSSWANTVGFVATSTCMILAADSSFLPGNAHHQRLLAPVSCALRVLVAIGVI
jgi:hypothetical protein